MNEKIKILSNLKNPDIAPYLNNIFQSKHEEKIKETVAGFSWFEILCENNKESRYEKNIRQHTTALTKRLFQTADYQPIQDYFSTITPNFHLLDAKNLFADLLMQYILSDTADVLMLEKLQDNISEQMFSCLRKRFYFILNLSRHKWYDLNFAQKNGRLLEHLTFRWLDNQVVTFLINIDAIYSENKMNEKKNITIPYMQFINFTSKKYALKIEDVIENEIPLSNFSFNINSIQLMSENSQVDNYLIEKYNVKNIRKV